MPGRRTEPMRDHLALAAPPPSWIEPMQAVAGDPPASSGAWLWEPRVKGLRCLAFVLDGQAQLRSASGTLLNSMLPALSVLLPALVRGNAVLDGVFARGVLHLFDCLHYEGVSLEPLPLTDRRAVLRDAVWFDDAVRCVPVCRSPGGASAQGHQSAGLVAKRADSRYLSGPSRDWLDVANAQASTFLIGGYVHQSSSDVPEALLIGVNQGGRLTYAGRVARACEPGAFDQVGGLLRRLRRRTTPFDSAVPQGENIQWTAPALVAQIGFADWTRGGLLRQPRFIGLKAEG